MEKKKLTAANGRPIADNQNSQTAGQRGPVMLQDPWLIEKLAHFDLHSGQILKLRGFAVNGICTFAVESFHTVDRITDYVHQSSFNLFANRHRDRASGGIHFHASLKSVRSMQHRAAHPRRTWGRNAPLPQPHLCQEAFSFLLYPTKIRLSP